MECKKTFNSLTLFIILLIFLTGCKSHKKPKAEIFAEEIIEVEISKDKKKNNHDKLIEEVLSWIGTPYKYGGAEKGKGTDCSGMVLKIYEMIEGVKLPRNSKKQAEACKKISPKSVKAGDLVFFATNNKNNEISHVGIMIDKERFVHASGSKGVIISEISTPYYSRNFVMFGRVKE